MLALNSTLTYLNVKEIYKEQSLQKQKNTHPFQVYMKHSFGVDHTSGHKTNISIFKTEIMFSEHSSMRLEINYKKKTAKTTNIWRLNNMLLNNQWIIEEIKGRIKKKIPGDK